MSKKAFEKFINKKPTGAKLKESIKVEKRKAKAETSEAMRKARAEKFQRLGKQAAEQKFGAPLPEASKESNFKKFKSNTNPGKPANIKAAPVKAGNTELMPLNKYLAHSGISARREAAEIIKSGKVTVNGTIIYEPGFKVTGLENIIVGDKKTTLQKNLVYILLNKPKDHLCTLNDPQGRKTVMDLIKTEGKERMYPVGRLDRNTTGVLLITNDGELSQKLTHPSFGIKKIYEVGLDKVITKKDMETIAAGITLEDGFIQPDALSYSDPKDKSSVGIEIHSGKNRIVKRIFEHLGYEVKKLDRVMFANLTKKNVDRGTWRFLMEKEVRLLKYMNQSFVKKAANKKASNAVINEDDDFK